METPKHIIEWTADDVEKSTSERAENMEHAFANMSDARRQRYDEDKRHQYRMNQQICKYCSYIASQIAMQAFWGWYCSKCGDKHTESSSAHPTWCIKCAEDMGVCTYCGAKMD